MEKTIFEKGNAVLLKGAESFGEIIDIKRDVDGNVFYKVSFDNGNSATVTASELEPAKKWRIRLDSLVEFSTPLDYNECDAVARFFEELTYIGDGLKHDYNIREVAM